MILSYACPWLWVKLDRLGMFSKGSEPARLAQYHRASNSKNWKCKTQFSKNWTEESTQDLEVLITAHKYRSLIPRSLSSATSALKHFEQNGGRGGIVVVEDVGMDGTWEYLLSMLETAEVPIRILQPRANLGLAAARNLALESTNATSIFFLDADNEVHCHALDELYTSLCETGAAVAYGPIEVVQKGKPTQRQISATPPDRKHLMTVGNHIDAMALYRTSSLKTSGGWSTELLAHGWGLEDHELWVRWLLEDRPWSFYPQPIGTYHEKEDSMSKALNPLTEESIYAYMRSLYGPEFKVSRET